MHNSANHMHALFASLWLGKTKESLKVVPDLRKSSMNFFLNSVIWSLLLGYSNNEKKEGGPRIGYGDIRRQKGGIF